MQTHLRIYGYFAISSSVEEVAAPYNGQEIIINKKAWHHINWPRQLDLSSSQCHEQRLKLDNDRPAQPLPH